MAKKKQKYEWNVFYLHDECGVDDLVFEPEQKKVFFYISTAGMTLHILPVLLFFNTAF